MDKPIRLTPSLRERVWGKTRLAPWYPDSTAPIGEAWFLSDRELPLLVKWIFTDERLSVQVHPDDGEDGPRGKTEMWHILEAAPGATIAMGFREPVKREQLWEATRTGEVEQLLHWTPVKAGETYFIPAHTVHAIGAGIVLCEIQQNSDVTYRLWDYGRPREIHVEKAVPLCDLGLHPGASRAIPLGNGREELVRSRQPSSFQSKFSFRRDVDDRQEGRGFLGGGEGRDRGQGHGEASGQHRGLHLSSVDSGAPALCVVRHE